MRNALPRKLLIGSLIFLLACSSTPPYACPGGACQEGESDPPGTPRSLDFGYGARLDANGPQDMGDSLRLAARMNLDWVALDFDWNFAQPAPNRWNEDSAFSNAIQLAHSLGLATLVSVNNPPAWAMTSAGPDAEETANLVLTLRRQHPNLAAVEIFPGANTRAGWNAAPDAKAYARLFETTQARLEAEGLNVYLVAGGLRNTLASPEDARDVDFLGQLYAAGLRPDVLSIRLESVTGDPLAPPAPDTLRHYEEIRVVMTANGHNEGLLWITGLNLPVRAEEETWLKQAYQVMKSQLYLGAVFYSGWNVDIQPVEN